MKVDCQNPKCSISDNLPAGLVFDDSLCTISGTPNNLLSPKTFIVSLKTLGGKASSSINLTVVPGPPTLSFLGVSLEGVVNSELIFAPIFLNNNGAEISNCSIFPALPAGLSINSRTCVMSGKLTVLNDSTFIKNLRINNLG